MAHQDLTYTYLHMTHRDLLILDTFENAQTYLSGEISDEGTLYHFLCEMVKNV